MALNRRLYLGYLLSEFRVAHVGCRLGSIADALSTVSLAGVSRSTGGPHERKVESAERNAQEEIGRDVYRASRTSVRAACVSAGRDDFNRRDHCGICLRPCKHGSGTLDALGWVLLDKAVLVAESDQSRKSWKVKF